MAGSLLAPLIGWVVDKFGPQTAILGGLLTFSAGLAMMKFVDSTVGFYLIWGLYCHCLAEFSENTQKAGCGQRVDIPRK